MMMTAENYPTNGRWTTEDEIDFVRRLGTHTRGLFLGQREQLLRGYLAGLDRRDDCSFNVPRVRTLVQTLLLVEQARKRTAERKAIRHDAH